MSSHRAFYELRLRKKTIKLRLPWPGATRSRRRDGDVIAAGAAGAAAGAAGAGAGAGATEEAGATPGPTRHDEQLSTSEGTQTELPEHPEHPEHPEQSEQSEHAEQSEQSEHPEQSEHSDADDEEEQGEQDESLTDAPAPAPAPATQSTPPPPPPPPPPRPALFLPLLLPPPPPAPATAPSPPASLLPASPGRSPSPLPVEHELPALVCSPHSSPVVAATVAASSTPPSPSTPLSTVSPVDTPVRTKAPSLAMAPAPLNPEPSAPDVREARHLPPKSYADAAEEALDAPSTPSNASDETAVHKHQGSPILSFEPSGLEGADGTKEHEQHETDGIHANGRISIPTAKESEHYEGEGQDSSPKSPSRGHKRKTSQKTNGSIGRKQGEHSDSDVYEKHQDGHGRLLTSAKPPSEYEKDSRQDDQPRDQQLTTGREAGAGWHTSKIRWAPFNVPVKRRLQTLAVLMHTLSIAGLVGFFFVLCSIPLLWPILVPYLVYALMSNAGASGELYFRSERCRRLPVWSLFASYFPMRLHRVQELEPTRKYIFGYHPHGIISHGAFAAFATEALGFSQLFPGITNTLLTLDSNFRLPLYREYALRMGLASVSRESIINILSRGGTNGEGMGRAVTIVIGGAREALEARPGHMRLVIERRKGFAKLAIRTGSDLVPVLAFGENDIYDQFDVASRPYVKKLQMLVKKVAGFTTPLFHARGIFNYDVGLMPYRKPINIVVGKPIRVKQEAHPDKATVDRVHGQYVAELQRLYDEWKDTFAEDRVEDMKFIE